MKSNSVADPVPPGEGRESRSVVAEFPLFTPEQALSFGPIFGMTRCTVCTERLTEGSVVFVADAPLYGWFCSWKCVGDFAAKKALSEARP